MLTIVKWASTSTIHKNQPQVDIIDINVKGKTTKLLEDKKKNIFMISG